MGKTYPKKLITAGITKITVRLNFWQQSKMTHILKLPGCAVHISRLSRRSKAKKAEQIQPTQMAITAFVHNRSVPKCQHNKQLSEKKIFATWLRWWYVPQRGGLHSKTDNEVLKQKTAKEEASTTKKQDKGDNAIIVFFSFARLCLLIWYPITYY